MLETEKKLREQYIRFGSLISHEFRSPLGIIEAQAALLTRQTGDDGQKKRLSIISSATHRLALLFDRWLQGDRLENKIDNDRPELIQLNHWLSELIGRCKQYHPHYSLSFTQHPGAPILVADEKMLEVVVLNLIDNACKYSPAQSVVRIKIILTSEKLGISIIDMGIGIDPSNHQRIFEEFVQIETSPKKKGYGLGLSFVKKVMEFYGGEIQVISTLGHGAEFIAWFSEKSIAHLEQ
jgi:signal transduction histidine kinase